MLRKITAIAGIILAMTPFLIFPVCDTLRPDGSHMSCWYSGVLITVSGALIFIMQFVKKFPALRLIITLCLAVSCWLVPQRIIDVAPFGLCANIEHSCRAVMIPSAGVIVIAIAAVSIAELVMIFVRGK